MTIEELRSIKAEFVKKAEELSALYKKLYGKIDISEPMSNEEKQLKEQVNKMWSQVNEIVFEIRKIQRQK